MSQSSSSPAQSPPRSNATAAQALTLYNVMSRDILCAIVAFETTVIWARHPRVVHDVIAELHCLVALMLHLGDWAHFSRLLILMRRARVTSFRLCHALIHRCAQLVDATDHADCTGHVADVTSYDAVASAVSSCDDVLVYMVPTEEAFYCQQLRPRLVSVLDYLNESSSPDHDDLWVNDIEWPG